MHAALRRAVEERAGQRCEYCRLHHDFQPLAPFHVEHIIARQHGGDDSLENPALACHRCNLHKGPNLTSIAPETGELTPLFNPRRNRWAEHFELRQARIIGLTSVGRTTATLLRMNTPDRIELRYDLLAAGLGE
jgi:5-methylcytosine-specific restriction endonuclease McrA